jgi:hypothetical protein
MELSQLKPGEAVVTGQVYGREERFLRIHKVAKVTLTGRQPQVVLDNGDRYKIETGFGIGGLGDPILRLATQEDFDREQAQRQKTDASRNQIARDEATERNWPTCFPWRSDPALSAHPRINRGISILSFTMCPRKTFVI